MKTKTTLTRLVGVVSALATVPSVVADDAPFNEIQDTCGNDKLTHAVSYTANFFCTEKLTKAVPGFDCSKVGFEVVSASQQGAGDEAVFKGIFALTDQDQNCVIGFSGTIDWFGGMPKIVFLGIEKCGQIDYVGNCNKEIEIASRLAEPLEEKSSEVESEATEEKEEEEEEEEEEIAEDVKEEEEEIEIEKEEEEEIEKAEEQQEELGMEDERSENKDSASLENTPEVLEVSNNPQEETMNSKEVEKPSVDSESTKESMWGVFPEVEQDTSQTPQEEVEEEKENTQEEYAHNEEENFVVDNGPKEESMWDVFPEVEQDKSPTPPEGAMGENEDVNTGAASYESQASEVGYSSLVETENQSAPLQAEPTGLAQSNTTSTTTEEMNMADNSPGVTQETTRDEPEGEALIGVEDGEELEPNQFAVNGQDMSPASEQEQAPNNEQAEVATELVAEELEQEEDMAKELEEDESTWNFKGSIDECSRFGVSPAEGIVFVCDETAYVCGFSLQFRERFLLLTQDPVVDGCDFGKVSAIASSREECNFFPTNEHHLKRDGRQQEQVVQCPNGSLLSSYYMFCSQELDNYYCDGAVCDTCEAVSRKFLRH